jgi:hypothetical protein
MHRKPTQEELDAQVNKALEEPKDDGLQEEEKVEEVEEEIKEPEEEVEEKHEETPGPKKEPVKEEKPAIPDIETRYKESTRESQILYSKNKKVFEVLDKANQLPEPTEDDLKKEFNDWEIMSDLEKRFAKNDLWNRRKFEAIGEATKEFKDIDAWSVKVGEFIDNPETLIEYPELEGKVEEFKTFATKPTRRGVDFEDLVASFSWDLSKKAPKQNKGKQLESGSSGVKEKQKPKSDKISLSEANKLRETNYNKWKQYVNEGKIDFESVE